MRLLTNVADIKDMRALVHSDDGFLMGVKEGDKVNINNIDTGKTMVVPVMLTHKLENIKGYIVVSESVASKLSIANEDAVEVNPSSGCTSLKYIKRKISGDELSEEEIGSIIKDSLNGNLIGTEISAFLVAVTTRGMTMDEVGYLTKRMAFSGETIKFDRSPVVDHHSIGGAPGNKVTLVVVPTVAAAGYLVPKTCSRAITGAAGTADLMGSIAGVTFSASEIKEMTEKAGAVIVWGGGGDFVPIDDIFISHEKPLGLNPRSVMLSSIVSKKLAAGSTHCVLDIPIGPGSKVADVNEGKALAEQFSALGDKIGMKIRSVITNGESPVGRTIGVNLEVSEALSVLENKGHGVDGFIQKSILLAGTTLETVGAVPQGDGVSTALKYIRSGKSLEKMKEIIEVQGGDPRVKSEDLVPGDFSYDVVAPKDGYVFGMLNRMYVDIARAAGCPSDYGAGIRINKSKGQPVAKGETIFTIYAEKEWKLSNALNIVNESLPVVLDGTSNDSFII